MVVDEWSSRIEAFRSTMYPDRKTFAMWKIARIGRGKHQKAWKQKIQREQNSNPLLFQFRECFSIRIPFLFQYRSIMRWNPEVERQEQYRSSRWDWILLLFLLLLLLLFRLLDTDRRLAEDVIVVTWYRPGKCTELVVIRARMSDLLWAPRPGSIFWWAPGLFSLSELH